LGLKNRLFIVLWGRNNHFLAPLKSNFFRQRNFWNLNEVKFNFFASQNYGTSQKGRFCKNFTSRGAKENTRYFIENILLLFFEFFGAGASRSHDFLQLALRFADFAKRDSEEDEVQNEENQQRSSHVRYLTCKISRPLFFFVELITTFFILLWIYLRGLKIGLK